MKTPIASRLVAALALLAVAQAASAVAPKAPRVPASAASAATAPAAPASVAERRATPGNRQHQLLGRCSQQVDAKGLSGTARKQAMSECLRSS